MNTISKTEIQIVLVTQQHTMLGWFLQYIPLLIAMLIGVFYFGMSNFAAAQVTLSGTIYSDAGVTPDGTTRTISVAVGTSTPGFFSSTSMVTTGDYTVTLPVGSGIASGTPILVWIDGGAVFGSVITKASTSAEATNISGLDLYRNRLIIRHEAGSGTSTTNTDLSFYTAAQDADLRHSTSSTGVVVRAGTELYLWTGKTFAPGGTITVSGNASGDTEDGSFYLDGSSSYIAGGTLSLAGSLTALSSVTFTTGNFNTVFNATTTGKVIDAPIPSVGNVLFDGLGGSWTFVGQATTSALTIAQGVVIAPIETLGITGAFQNYGRFIHNDGTVNITSVTTEAERDIARYVAGRDVNGSATGPGTVNTNHLAVSGNYLYVAKVGSATACSQTVGSASGCELMVFDISSSTNPVYVAGRDASGDASGSGNLAVNNLAISGNYLYVAKVGDTTACSQTAGSALGCELMVFDISSSTNPVYVAGLDSDGSTTGSTNRTINALLVNENELYIAKTGGGIACSQTAGSAIGCELMVFDISSSTNPVYVAGRDVTGSASGSGNLASTHLVVSGNFLYFAKAGSNTACSQTAGSAIGCELMVFDISSTTNPVYVAGRDAGGSAGGGQLISLRNLGVSGQFLYVAKAGDPTACSQTAGSALGCELMVFDISSTTNPVYVAGRDVGGSFTGVQNFAINSVYIKNNYLYAAKAANVATCAQKIGFATGCELLIFDISSSTYPNLLAGRDGGGSSGGTQTVSATAVTGQGNVLIMSKSGSNTACSQTAGSAVGCEIMIFDTSLAPAGVLSGTLTGTSQLNHIQVSGLVDFRADTEVVDLTIMSGTTSAPQLLTISGDYTNNANFVADEGVVTFSSSSAQEITGNLMGPSGFYEISFTGTSTKTLMSTTTATIVSIENGATVMVSEAITVSDTVTNHGTLLNSASAITAGGYLNEFTVGLSAGGSQTDEAAATINALARNGDRLYVVKVSHAGACSQTAGSAVGCELMVFDISSTTNPVYVAGRDANGSATNTTAVGMLDVVVSGDYLYVAKDGNATACSQAAGSALGCELMVFDISSTTNPVYVAGRDADGSAAGTTVAEEMRSLTVMGNYLYVAKAAGSTACSQAAGSASGCELMVFDISSSTNPVYVAGRDANGSATNTTAVDMRDVAVSGDYLYVAKVGNATACSQTAGSAVGCELMVFDISSTTNPVYVAGRDAGGSAGGSQNSRVNNFAIINSYLYVAKTENTTACSQTAGSAVGCELMVFDISSTTNPVYVAGRDAGGDASGTQASEINNLQISDSFLYVAKAGDATACSQAAGSAVGCELMVFDISSTTNPVYVAGRDVDSSWSGQESVGVQALLPIDSVLVVAKSGNNTACEQAVGLRIGCELVFHSLVTNLSGNFSGSSTLSDLTVNGRVQFTEAEASTTNLIINGSLHAPSATLSIAGNLTQNGTFHHNNGSVALIGENQNLTSLATTTFFNLIKQSNTPATTTFGTTGIFVTEGVLHLQGTSSSRLKLRSSNEGLQWNVLPLGSTSVSYVDVKDARNSSSTYIDCTVGCVDRGNNMNWTFTPVVFGTGSSTISNHSGGQIGDAFNAEAATNEPLLAFQLTPETGAATVVSVKVNLTGIKQVSAAQFSNIRLVIDRDNNKQYSGADTPVGGAAELSIANLSGYIIFSEPFSATTSLNYLVVADWTTPNNGSFMNVSLTPADIHVRDEAGFHALFGDIVQVQHSRNNRAGGGSSANVGDAPPSGAGTVSGGSNPGGELIGNQPDYFWPSSQSGSWTNGAAAYDQVDGTYASTNGVDNHQYTNHGFIVPGSNTVQGIVIKLELSGTTGAGTVDVQLSWDGGTSWTATKSTATLGTSDVVYTLGAPSDLWGRSWSVGEFSNANFAVRVIGNPSSNTVRLDAIQARVYHIAGGGGGGGGGAI